MTQPDPWTQQGNAMRAGQEGQQGGQGSSQAVADREAEFRAMGGANPFATPDQILGGTGERGPQWPDLLDRLVVLKPVKKMLNQPVPNQPNQAQDFYSCEMTVLDGGKLTIVTPAKPASGDKPALPESSTDYEPPHTFSDWWAHGKGITVKLDNLGANPLYLGVVKRCPTGPGYKAGHTWRDATAEWDAYVKRLQTDPARAGGKPQFSWGLIDPTPEGLELGLTWWQNRQVAGTSA